MDLAQKALERLRTTPKRLPMPLLYDEIGIALLQRMKRSEQYYLATAELALLDRIRPALRRVLPSHGILVEYGASSLDKARPVVEALRPTHYVPIDIERGALRAVAEAARRCHGLSVHEVHGDFDLPIALPIDLPRKPRIGLMAGSTVSTYGPAAAAGLFERMRATLGAGAWLLLGVDTPKSRAVLERAYDDEDGRAATFARNMLLHLNRLAGTGFNPARFDYRAAWNEADSVVEMWLISRAAQAVAFGPETVRFEPGEKLLAAWSYKYATDTIAHAASASGWIHREAWIGGDPSFGIHLLEAR